MRLVELMQWHAPALFELTGDPRVTKYLGFRTHETVHDAARLIASYAASPGAWWAAVDASGRLAGVVGMEVQGCSVAIALYGNPRARGFGRTVSVTLIDEAFKHSDKIWRVWAHCHHLNLPVQRVMERLGATREGLLRKYQIFPNISDEPQDCYVYSIIRDDVRREAMQAGAHATKAF